MRSVRLDTRVSARALSQIDVVKIDVESAEKLVIEGARETVARLS